MCIDPYVSADGMWARKHEEKCFALNLHAGRYQKSRFFLEALAPIDMIIFELRKIKCKCARGVQSRLRRGQDVEQFSRLFNKKNAKLLHIYSLNIYC